MPNITTALFSKEEIEKVNSSRNETRFQSQLKCFRSHNGIRPAELSALIGPKGNGKSSMAKTIGFDSARSYKNTYFLLSEEASAVYKSGFSNALNRIKEDERKNIARKMFFDSMLDWESHERTAKLFLSHIERQINDFEIDQLIFDNFSTSFLSQLPVNEQGKIIEDLRKIADVYDMAMIGVFHTIKGTDVYARLIDGEDVRGNATSTNTSSYVYLLTTFFNAEPKRAIFHIDKARYHKNANKTYWDLVFDAEIDMYVDCDQIDYNTAKAIMEDTKKKSADAIKKLIENPDLLTNSKIRKKGIWQ